MNTGRNSFADASWRSFSAAIASSIAVCLGGLSYILVHSVLNNGDTLSVDSLAPDRWIFFLFSVILPVFALLICLTVVPVIVLLRRFGKTQVHYTIFVFLLVIGPFILVVGSMGASGGGRIYSSDVALILFCMLPAGLTFHKVEQGQPPDRPGGWLGAVAIIWGVAMFVFGFSRHLPPWPGPFFGTDIISAYHPLADKKIVRATWSSWGYLFFYLAGVAAFVVAPRSRQAGLTLLMAALMVPIGVLVWYFLIPLRPEHHSFQIGKRTVSLSWKLEPRFANGALHFNAQDKGPYKIIGPGVVNKNLNITLSSRPLAEIKSMYEGQGGFSLGPDGMECQDTTLQNGSGNLCMNRETNGRITTLIKCERSYCVHWFEHGELRLWLHYDPDDVKNWRHIEKLSVELLEEKTISQM